MEVQDCRRDARLYRALEDGHRRLVDEVGNEFDYCDCRVARRLGTGRPEKTAPTVGDAEPLLHRTDGGVRMFSAPTHTYGPTERR